jgi:hypothetical protein
MLCPQRTFCPPRGKDFLRVPFDAGGGEKSRKFQNRKIEIAKIEKIEIADFRV